jgi:hypothetical protein
VVQETTRLEINNAINSDKIYSERALVVETAEALAAQSVAAASVAD